MPNRSRSKAPENRPSTPESSAKVVEQSAIRHVGPTLESDPEYNELPAREFAPAAALLSRHGNDLTASPDMRDPEERLRDQADAGTEELKTRLPGDTSSDPHTDLGPNNAAAVPHRGEQQKKHK